MGIIGEIKKVGKKITGGIKKVAKGVTRGIKKVVKGIGRRVKSAFKSFGKFMNKIGIIGQIGMMFILPAVGSQLLSTFANLAQGAIGYSGVGASIVNAAGHAMKFAHTAVTKAGTVFSNVTKGIGETVNNFSKTLGNKLGLKTTGAENFFGAGDSAFSRSFGENSRFQNLTLSKAEYAEKLSKAAEAVSKEASSATKATVGDTGSVPDQIKTDTGSLLSEVKPKSTVEDPFDMGFGSEFSEINPEILTKEQNKLFREGKFAELQDSLTAQQKRTNFVSDLQTTAGRVKDKTVDFVKSLPEKTVEYAKTLPSRAAKELEETIIDAPADAVKQYTITAAQQSAMKDVLGDDYLTPQVTQYAPVFSGINTSSYQPDAYQAPALERIPYENMVADGNVFGNTAYNYAGQYSKLFQNRFNSFRSV